jgi:hypothetical protein
MFDTRTPRGLGLTSLITAFAMAITMAFVSGGNAEGTAPAARASTLTTVAHAPSAKIKSAISGTTAAGDRVTGTYTPMKFYKKNGHVRSRGVFNGVIHNADGTTKTFTIMRSTRVKSIEGTGVTNARQAAQRQASCDILHLVLAPLDLDLLGLQVHLDRVVLNIVAVSGAGNLLGNLLCAITGLLDGGLGGQLGQLTNLLNQILQRLLMGL